MTFPIVDAYLVQPEEGQNGKIGICTNTTAPGMVINEIPLNQRNDITALGSLVVNRDGAERMIINCLSHPTLEYLILFGNETVSFKPSTNILLALMNGYNENEKGNAIQDGKGISPQYPNIAPKLLGQFRKRMKVIPIFTTENKEVIQQYMNWLKPQIPQEIYDQVIKIQGKKKIYYDSLQKLVQTITKQPTSENTQITLDPKDFQQLQPPIIELEGENQITIVPFRVTRNKDEMTLDLDIDNQLLTITGKDSWEIAYALVEYMNENKLKLTPLQELLLGTELSRVEMEIRENLTSRSITKPNISLEQRKQIPLTNQIVMKPDTEYYYKVGLRKGQVSIQSLTHDSCKTVFELRSKRLYPIIKKLAEENRFQNYEQQALHRIDTGVEITRAIIALDSNQNFFQDFRNLFTVNKTNFPLFITEADSFLKNHQKIITNLYTKGLEMPHADAHKGTMRSATTLAIFRRSQDSLKNFPKIYSLETQTVQEMREKYKQQLQEPGCEGAYTYGSRTRAYFGKDQLLQAIDFLKENPDKPFVIQRFDYVKDMTLTKEEIKDDNGNTTRTRLKATKDPCLTNDIYFLSNGRLHSFHTARAHNMVNAYPENIFGLHDAYDAFIAEKLGVEPGDMYVLSSRGNILLLTEEQKVRKLIAEPSKPTSYMDNATGPYDISKGFPMQGIGYSETNLEKQEEKPIHPCLPALENYEGVNLIEKVSDYLKQRGDSHNNPIIGTFNPKTQEHGNAQRLIYFQCNQRAGQLQATAVFTNGTPQLLDADTRLCNYIATQYGKKTNLPLGKLFLFYVPVRGE